jgi:hypothetical protein
MLYALIFPNQKVKDGVRILELSTNPFDVAPPLFWKECTTDLYRGEWYYDMNTEQFVEIPAPPPAPTSGEAPNVID